MPVDALLLHRQHTAVVTCPLVQVLSSEALTATVTNYRLILVPQTRKPHPPASIPKLYIYRIRNVTLSQREAVQIRLKIGYDLNLFVGWGLYNEFTHELSAMIAPPPQVAYKPALSQEDLVRLIEQISEI